VISRPRSRVLRVQFLKFLVLVFVWRQRSWLEVSRPSPRKGYGKYTCIYLITYCSSNVRVYAVVSPISRLLCILSMLAFIMLMGAIEVSDKCVSRIARRKSHHTVLCDAAAPNSQCPATVAAVVKHSRRVGAGRPYLCRRPRDSPRANVHQNGRRPVRIVGQHACKISCP